MPKKKKRLTQREKAMNARVKKELREKGLIPPPKARLNRKKFARETWDEFNAFLKTDYIRAETALLKSIGFMVGPDLPEITPEQVGVLKLLRLAMEYDKFRRELETEGHREYALGELFDKVIFPTINL